MIRSSMIRAVPVLALPFLLLPQALAQGGGLETDAPRVREEVRSLITRLGSPGFEARKQAAAELEKLGPGVLSALRKALRETDDPEARWQVRRLIRRIQGQKGGLKRAAPGDRKVERNDRPQEGWGFGDLEAEIRKGLEDLGIDLDLPPFPRFPRGDRFVPGFPGLEDLDDPGDFARRIQERMRRWMGDLPPSQWRSKSSRVKIQSGPEGVEVEIQDDGGKPRRYEARDMESLLRKHPELRRRISGWSSPRRWGFPDREPFDRGFPFDEQEGDMEIRSRSVILQMGPDGVRVEIQGEGDEARTYEAEDIPSLLRKHPELRRHIRGWGLGGFRNLPWRDWPGLDEQIERIEKRLFEMQKRFEERFGKEGRFHVPPFGKDRFRLFRPEAWTKVERKALRKGGRKTPGKLVPEEEILEEEIEAPAGEGPKLGIYIGDRSTAEVARFLGLPEGVGLWVADTLEGSYAGKLGLQEGDLLVKLNGKWIRGPSDVAAVLRGDAKKLQAVYYRKGAKKDAAVDR